ncbi:MAG: HAD family hydrolase [Deltaproteobacteria bacterium]|nr:HAD family hydrolase [Deltaproteobacteria bacterium]
MLSKNAVAHYLKPLSPIPTNINPSGTIDGVLRCILFDIYGTLFISETGEISTLKLNSDKLNTINRLLAKYHIRKDPNRILEEVFEAISNKHKILQNSGINVPEIQIDRIWMDITGRSDESVRDFATEFELIINPVSPMPHLKKLITACRASGLLMGIISNAQFYTEYLFHWFLGSSPEGLGFHKDMLFYSYISGHAKPSQYMFKSASAILNKMGIAEDSVLYVGNDMRNDIWTGNEVGFKTALFAGDARSLKLRKNDSTYKDIYPDITVTDLNQLIKFL